MNLRLNPTHLLVLLAFLVIVPSLSQTSDEVEFGNPKVSEIGPLTYPEDPEAAAVILYEKGETTVEVVKRYLRLVTTVHIKTKVLNAKEYGDAVVEIPFYDPEKRGEKIRRIKALTHNGNLKQFVGESGFFVKDLGNGWKSMSFTFPNLKDQSLLEYTYTLESPYFHNFNWNFQEEYPKAYSEYITEIPGNYEYRIGFRGFLEFDSHDQHIKKKCFYIDGMGKTAECYYNRYIMKNIPPFKEEEYMLSKENYISQLRYELKEYMDLRGIKSFYTKRWEDVDDEFQYDKEIGRQLNNKNYFRKNLSEQLFGITDPLERAKAIYYTIQNHFTWNQQYRMHSDIDVKEAYERGTGNISEINLSLINALQEADLDAYISLSATRDKSVPTELFPVLTEFNYIMAFLKIGDDFYFLDASNKHTPFGIIPFRALNYKARIMDFKNGSYWHPIAPTNKNQNYINAQLTLNDDLELTGEVQEINSGYFGYLKRNHMSNRSKEELLEEKAKEFFLVNYSAVNPTELEEPLKEIFYVRKEVDEVQGDYYIYPFFLGNAMSKNPFKLETRDFPIDFGFPRNITYLITINLGENLKIKFIPENRTFKLPESFGGCQVMYHELGNTINIRFQLRLSKTHITSEYYQALKKFYEEVVKIINKEVIVLSKS